MAMVEIGLKVDERAFIPVMRVLKALQGVEIHWDLDKIDGPKRKPKSLVNGAKPVREEVMRTVLLAFLFERGPQDLAALKALLASKGFAESSVHSALNELRNKGLTETGGPGVHKLTEKAMAGMQSEITPPLALPPPPEKPAKRLKVLAVILNALQRAPTSKLTRPELTECVKEYGLAPRSIDNAMYRGRAEGFVKPADGSDVYELTAKGKKFTPQTEKD